MTSLKSENVKRIRELSAEAYYKKYLELKDKIVLSTMSDDGSKRKFDALNRQLNFLIAAANDLQTLARVTAEFGVYLPESEESRKNYVQYLWENRAYFAEKMGIEVFSLKKPDDREADKIARQAIEWLSAYYKMHETKDYWKKSKEKGLRENPYRA